MTIEILREKIEGGRAAFLMMKVMRFCSLISMDEKISVIVPVYKVEAYLEKCLDSIVRQTYRNLEVILVDDGSPDGCGEICDKYVQKDARFQVIHKRNEGAAKARNVGIDVATGTYISFVDSDDWIADDAYELLYEGLKKFDADCAVGECVRVSDDGVELKRQSSKKEREAECQSAEDWMKELLLHGSAAWNRLFKRELFQTIRFPEGKINEDEPAVLHVYAQCSKIVWVHRNTYFYRKRKNSVTTSKFSVKKLDAYYNAKDNMEFIKKVRPQLSECAEYKYMLAALYCYVNLKRMKKNEEIQALCKMLKKSIRDGRKQAMSNRYLKMRYKILMNICAL